MVSVKSVNLMETQQNLNTISKLALKKYIGLFIFISLYTIFFFNVLTAIFLCRKWYSKTVIKIGDQYFQLFKLNPFLTHT